MMNVIACICVFVVFCQAKSNPYSGPGYESQNRGTKMGLLWDNITQFQKPADWYGAFASAELLVESMDPTFTASDDMPFQYPGKFVERKKLIHSVGVIAKCTFNITNNPRGYTGLFATGADTALIRLSLAQEPKTTQQQGCFAPGIAIKFMRDGVSSGNLVSMFALNGQDNFNFFEHDFTNHVPSLGSWADFALKAVAAKFKQFSDWPTMVGLSNMAKFDQKGNSVDTPKFPYRLVFHPNYKYHVGFPRNYTGAPFYEVLSKGLEKGHIYDVYAQDKPLQSNDQLFKIGTISLQTNAFASFYGDRHFFIQHTKMEDDVAYHPEWASLIDQDVSNQEAASAPGYKYGDLPFTSK